MGMTYFNLQHLPSNSQRLIKAQHKDAEEQADRYLFETYGTSYSGKMSVGFNSVIDDLLYETVQKLKNQTLKKVVLRKNSLDFDQFGSRSRTRKMQYYPSESYYRGKSANFRSSTSNIKKKRNMDDSYMDNFSILESGEKSLVELDYDKVLINKKNTAKKPRTKRKIIRYRRALASKRQKNKTQKRKRAIRIAKFKKCKGRQIRHNNCNKTKSKFSRHKIPRTRKVYKSSYDTPLKSTRLKRKSKMHRKRSRKILPRKSLPKLHGKGSRKIVRKQITSLKGKKMGLMKCLNERSISSCSRNKRLALWNRLRGICSKHNPVKKTILTKSNKKIQVFPLTSMPLDVLEEVLFTCKEVLKCNPRKENDKKPKDVYSYLAVKDENVCIIAKNCPENCRRTPRKFLPNPSTRKIQQVSSRAHTYQLKNNSRCKAEKKTPKRKIKVSRPNKIKPPTVLKTLDRTTTQKSGKRQVSRRTPCRKGDGDRASIPPNCTKGRKPNQKPISSKILTCKAKTGTRDVPKKPNRKWKRDYYLDTVQRSQIVEDIVNRIVESTKQKKKNAPKIATDHTKKNAARNDKNILERFNMKNHYDDYMHNFPRKTYSKENDDYAECLGLKENRSEVFCDYILCEEISYWRQQQKFGMGPIRGFSAKASCLVVAPDKINANLNFENSNRPLGPLHMIPFAPHSRIAANIAKYEQWKIDEFPISLKMRMPKRSFQAGSGRIGKKAKEEQEQPNQLQMSPFQITSEQEIELKNMEKRRGRIAIT